MMFNKGYVGILRLYGLREARAMGYQEITDDFSKAKEYIFADDDRVIDVYKWVGTNGTRYEFGESLYASDFRKGKLTKETYEEAIRLIKEYFPIEHTSPPSLRAALLLAIETLKDQMIKDLCDKRLDGYCETHHKYCT